MKTDYKFQVKGFHIDLRLQAMTMKALKDFAKKISAKGLNTLVMEWEATFPYDKHATISNNCAYTRKEIKEFIEYCGKLGIDVIPLQQCFGHTEYILRHERYKHLSEDRKDVSLVCPLKKDKAEKLFEEIFADIVSLHKSDYVHIGGDETWILGSCDECRKAAEKHGKSKLYVDYIKMICKILTKLGKHPVMWADIILKHPEAANELPKDTIFIDWNYGWPTNSFGDIDKLKKTGCEFWGAPALRSHPDNYFLTRWEYHFNNFRDFIPFAKKSQYNGIILTSWSTSGVYGYEWDSDHEVVEMYPIRRVYPLKGFDILLDAYINAIESETPLNPTAFIVKYAKERFGFKDDEARAFRQALKADPSVLIQGKMENGRKVESVLNSVKKTNKTLSKLKPSKNKEEFEHIVLMFEIREFYLEGKVVESFVQSEKFTLSKAPQTAEKLKKILKRAPKLEEKFLELNKGYLYPSELEKENIFRSRKLKLVYERLKRIK